MADACLIADSAFTAMIVHAPRSNAEIRTSGLTIVSRTVRADFSQS
jgi:hypothetical protein